jgi:protein gp37
MSDRTGISWTDATWNPIRGCSRVSEGCRHCYAERQALRITRFDRGLGKPEGRGAYDGLVHEVAGEARWTGQVRLVPELLDQPLRLRRPRRIFVNSMSDLFHESLSEDAILAVFVTMARAQRHTFQVLTKRPARMRAVLAKWQSGGLTLREGVTLREGSGAMLPNVWLGVSAEDQATLDARVPDLLRCPAAVRWVSLEPQLGPIDTGRYLGSPWFCPYCSWSGDEPAFSAFSWESAAFCPKCHTECEARTERLDWIVQGGESGPGARPFDLAWARTTRDQCREAGTAYYLKQLGAQPKSTDGRSYADLGYPEGVQFTGNGKGWLYHHLKHRSGADPAEWPEALRVQEFPR